MADSQQYILAQNYVTATIIVYATIWLHKYLQNSYHVHIYEGISVTKMEEKHIISFN